MAPASQDGFLIEVESTRRGYAVHFLGCTENFDTRQTAIAFAQTLADGRARVVLASHGGKLRAWIVEMILNGHWRRLTESRHGLFMPTNLQIVTARNAPAADDAKAKTTGSSAIHA